MRITFVALVLLGAASAAAAQSHGGLTDDMPTPSIGLPLPHIGLPLPPMGLPLPQMGLPPERARPSDRTSILEPPARAERAERSQRSERFNRAPAIVFFGWPYLPFAGLPSSPSPSPPPPPKSPTGRLLLSLHSGVDPQIFVDGYYVGLFSDIAGELLLDVGAHTIEFREEGFGDARVDVKIPLDGTITYDVVLRPIQVAALPSAAPIPPVPSPPPAPTTIYVVPGCYVGNVPPQQVKLPAGCDERRSITFPSR